MGAFWGDFEWGIGIWGDNSPSPIKPTMIGNNISQEDINLLMQSNVKINITIDILNSNLATIDNVEGSLISESFNVDVGSEIRNTISLSLAVTNNYPRVAEDGDFWLNRYIRVNIGFYSIKTKRYHWYNRGIFALKSYNIDHGETTTLSIEGVDMVAMYNGDLNGKLKALDTKILATEGENIRTVMIRTVTQLGGITKYQISDMPKPIPYDLEFSTGQTVWDIIVELRDLYMGWETFFDSDGTFVCQPIPTCISSQIVLDETILAPLITSDNGETINCDMSAVRNSTKVWGKCLDTDYYATSVTYDNGTYTATFNSLPVETDGKLSTGVKLAFKAMDTNVANPKIKIINGTTTIGTFDIVDDDKKPLTENKILANKTYVFRYRIGSVFFMGQWQIVAITKLMSTQPSVAQINAMKILEQCDNINIIVDPSSPFCIEKIGERMEVLSGGDYDKIYSDQLAIERSEYDNWRLARLTSTVTINVIYIPFLQGNSKIRYTLDSTKETKDFIIKKISGSLNSGTCSIEMVEFYPLYPFIVKK